ncbi:MAG: alpha-galactosidase [Promethearchaeota archaeon]
MVVKSFGNKHFVVNLDLSSGKASIHEKIDGRTHVLFKNYKWGYKLKDDSSFFSDAAGMDHSVSIQFCNTRFGPAKKMEIISRSSEMPIEMVSSITLLEHEPAFLLELLLHNTSSTDVNMMEIYPLITTVDDDSGFFFVKDLEKSRILEAGLASLFDLNVRCVFGNEESDSNGNVLIMDLLSGRSACCGVIDRSEAVIEIVANEDADEGMQDVDFGRCSFGDWKIKKTYIPFKKILPSRVLTSSKMFFNFNDNFNEFEKLEDYALRIAKNLNIRIWPIDRPIPHGWNSWGNPAKTDPYDSTGQNLAVLVHDLTEANVFENFEVAKNNLKRFKFEYFQIDDGYQKRKDKIGSCIGDWEPSSVRFPRGLKPVFDKIHEEGFKAGIWIRPFEITLGSDLHQAHPDWALEWEDAFPLKSKKDVPLDLSRGDVQLWLHDLMVKYKRYYGLEWIKTDFTYNLLGGKGFWNELLTPMEVFQSGFKVIRDAIGPDTFLVGVGGPCLLHYGLVDAERITLDVQPAWGRDGPMMPAEQGIKVNARIIARRYYLNGRVWITHCDVLQFRAPLKENEYIVQASVVGLACGIFKVGEKFPNMKPEHFDVVGKLLPIYRPKGRGMRPIDLFTAEYPEVWDLQVDGNERGLSTYHVVGLFNWGENVFLGKPVSEDTKVVTLNFKDIGLKSDSSCLIFEFWTETFKGVFKGKYEAEIEPRHVEVIRVVEEKNRPQILSSNRHLTQGIIDIIQVSWEDHSNILSFSAEVVENFEHHYHVHVPDSYILDKADCDDKVCIVIRVEKNHLYLKWKQETSGRKKFKVHFSRK